MPIATSSSPTRSASCRDGYLPISVVAMDSPGSTRNGDVTRGRSLAYDLRPGSDVPGNLQALPYTGTTAPLVTRLPGEARNVIVCAISSGLGHCSCLAL